MVRRLTVSYNLKQTGAGLDAGIRRQWVSGLVEGDKHLEINLIATLFSSQSSLVPPVRPMNPLSRVA
jgi:hypothetical protein